MIQENNNHPLFPHCPILPPEHVCIEMYTVKAGDTLYAISQSYGIPVAILMQANRILNPYCLKIGQRICIPGPANQDPICAGVVHTVAEGDTLYMIAKQHQVTLDAVINANPDLDPYNLHIGMKLCIPPTMEVPSPTMNQIIDDVYFIHIGDSFDTVCKRLGVVSQNLHKANPALSLLDFSVPGTKICIPR